MYYIYKDGRLIGSSNDIEYVIEFTKLMVDKAIDTEKDASRLRRLYRNKTLINMPDIYLNELGVILTRLGYNLSVDIE